MSASYRACLRRLRAWTVTSTWTPMDTSEFFWNSHQNRRIETQFRLMFGLSKKWKPFRNGLKHFRALFWLKIQIFASCFLHVVCSNRSSTSAVQSVRYLDLNLKPLVTNLDHSFDWWCFWELTITCFPRFTCLCTYRTFATNFELYHR